MAFWTFMRSGRFCNVHTVMDPELPESPPDPPLEEPELPGEPLGLELPLEPHPTRPAARATPVRRTPIRRARLMEELLSGIVSVELQHTFRKDAILISSTFWTIVSGS
jgi:hypothetical protein